MQVATSVRVGVQPTRGSWGRERQGHSARVCVVRRGELRQGRRPFALRAANNGASGDPYRRAPPPPSSPPPFDTSWAAEAGKPPPPPPPAEPKRLSAAEQMEVLKRAQLASAEQLQKANINPIIGADPNAPREFRGHRTVDVRMYDQLVASRNRMSQNLSRAKQYTNFLEEGIEERDERISILQKEFSHVVTEIENLVRMNEKALAAVQFSVEKKPSVDAVEKMMGRMQLLQAATAAHLEALDVWVVRDVPIAYSGTGSEVRIMGDFDGWTMGHLLSADSYDDSVYQTFTSTLRLTPGTYRVKFLVDDQWRTAGDWEIVRDEHGNEENLLIVK
uniref:AMP-activated protein kinase glycogen-binding domain-containing protein n=1 Tax=Tetraselmis chuii TaxID=63592 RepID=A0A7S1SUG3_9CHLO|mmetsp:Transcript_26196/g.46589  ORF Transcript_26196/g.46589 Transcript_26196/m.46589 type:complete len:333 (+) Transcript_26196:359-1357(+)